MGKAQWFVSLIMLGALLTSAAQAANEVAPTDSRSWLGADPGYGMRSWEDLYPGLNLTPEQKRQLADIRVETLREVCAARDDLKVPAAERMRKIREARQAGRQREYDVLTPEQQEYMRQHPPAPSPLLTRQPRGNAMRRVPITPCPPAAVDSRHPGYIPGVSTLTPEQANQVAAVRKEAQQQIVAVERDRTLTPQQRAARVREIQADAHSRVMAVLTEKQRAEHDDWWKQKQEAGSRKK